MHRIEFAEEKDAFLAAADLSNEQALALYQDHRFELEWPNPANNFQYRLRSNGWVGHIPIAGLTLIVQPKVPIGSIFAMLEVAYRLKSFHFLKAKPQSRASQRFTSALLRSLPSA